MCSNYHRQCITHCCFDLWRIFQWTRHNTVCLCALVVKIAESYPVLGTEMTLMYEYAQPPWIVITTSKVLTKTNNQQHNTSKGFAKLSCLHLAVSLKQHWLRSRSPSGLADLLFSFVDFYFYFLLCCFTVHHFCICNTSVAVVMLPCFGPHKSPNPCSMMFVQAFKERNVTPRWEVKSNI